MFTNSVDRSCHPHARMSASQGVPSKMYRSLFIPLAEHLTASRACGKSDHCETPIFSVSALYSKGARVYFHATTAACTWLRYTKNIKIQQLSLRYSSCRYDRRVRPRAERRYHAYHHPQTNKQIAIQLFLGQKVCIMRTTTH